MIKQIDKKESCAINKIPMMGIFLCLGVMVSVLTAQGSEITSTVVGSQEKPLTAVIVIDGNSCTDIGQANFSGFDSFASSVYPERNLNKHNWQYNWAFGDGATSTAPAPQHNYYKNPSDTTYQYVFTPTLTVTDNLDNTATDTISTKVYFYPNAILLRDISGNYITDATTHAQVRFPNPGLSRPKIHIDAQADEAPFTVYVDASASASLTGPITMPSNSFTNGYIVTYQGQNSIDTYTWDFGDGTTSNKIRTSHTYTIPGTYLVTLTTIDSYRIIIKNSNGTTNNTINHAITGIKQTIVRVLDPAKYEARIIMDEPATYRMYPNYNRSGQPVLLNRAYAPLPVFLQGWQSTPKQEIVDYAWDFGAGAENDEGGRYFSGFNAAHVYETPGIYTITLTTTYKNGQTSTSNIQVQALARDGSNYYVNSDPIKGNDANPGTAAQPWRTATKAFAQLKANKLGIGSSLYFERNQTFDLSELGYASDPNYKNPTSVFISANPANDPNLPKPKIQYSGTGSGNAVIYIWANQSMRNLTFADLEINLKSTVSMPGSPAILADSFISALTGGTRNITLLRVNGKNPGNGFLSFQAPGEQWYGSAIDDAPSGTFILGSKIEQTEVFLNAVMLLYYYGGTRLAIVDSILDHSNNHVAYTSFNKGVIANSTFSRPAFGRNALRITGTGGFYNPDNYILITQNKFLGWLDGIDGYAPITDPTNPRYDPKSAHNGGGTAETLVMVQLGPNTGEPKRIKSVMLEKNIFTNAVGLLQLSNAEDITVRNNIFVTNTTYGGYSGRVQLGDDYSAMPQTKPLQHIKIFGNTFIVNGTPSSGTWQDTEYTNSVFEVRNFYQSQYPNDFTDSQHPEGARAYYANWFGANQHQDIQIKNNIIYVPQGKKMRVIHFSENDYDLIKNQVKLDYNFYYLPGMAITDPANDNNSPFQIGGEADNKKITTPETLYTLDEWRSAYGQDRYSLPALGNLATLDPKFVSPVIIKSYLSQVDVTRDIGSPSFDQAISDAQLYMNTLKLNGQIPSPAINKGEDVGISTDMYGNLRPQGTYFDIGAFEYISTDSAAPSVPTNLSAQVASSSQINLSWSASTDDVGVAGYKVYRNGALVGTPTLTTYSDLSLVANTVYTYTVSAFDAAGNESAQSGSVSKTTLPITYALNTISTNGVITKTPDQANYVAGTTVQLSVTADGGYQFSGWSGSLTSAANPLSLIMDSDKTLTANYTAVVPTTYPVTDSVWIYGGGTITPATADVNAGSSLDINLTPTSVEYYILDVLDNDVSVKGKLVKGTGNSSKYTISNISGPHNVVAKFTVYTYPVTIRSGVGGVVSSYGGVTPVGGGTITSTFTSGASPIFTITPDAGYNIDRVLVDGVAVTLANGTYAFPGGVTAIHTIEASFKPVAPITYTITVSAGANGNISPFGAVTVNSGANQAFTITPNRYYKIVDVQVDGTSVGAVSNYVFNSVIANHTISASFTLKGCAVTLISDANGVVKAYTGVSTPLGGGMVTPTFVATSSPSFTITPNVGYSIASVSVDGVLQVIPISSSYQFGMIEFNHTISASFNIIPVQTVPAAPSNLIAKAVSASQINLTWSDKSSNEDGFKIERSRYSNRGFTQIATVGANVSSYSNTGLSRGTTYYYRVRAYNAVGNSAYTFVVKAGSSRR